MFGSDPILPFVPFLALIIGLSGLAFTVQRLTKHSERLNTIVKCYRERFIKLDASLDSHNRELIAHDSLIRDLQRSNRDILQHLYTHSNFKQTCAVPGCQSTIQVDPENAFHECEFHLGARCRLYKSSSVAAVTNSSGEIRSALAADRTA
jgi:hypothetical protein